MKNTIAAGLVSLVALAGCEEESISVDAPSYSFRPVLSETASAEPPREIFIPSAREHSYSDNSARTIAQYVLEHGEPSAVTVNEYNPPSLLLGEGEKIHLGDSYTFSFGSINIVFRDSPSLDRPQTQYSIPLCIGGQFSDGLIYHQRTGPGNGIVDTREMLEISFLSSDIYCVADIVVWFGLNKDLAFYLGPDDQQLQAKQAAALDELAQYLSIKSE